jgi:hypothetical protein
MATKLFPRYPIYVPSKGRYQTCYTAKFLAEDGVPFSLVVEEPERDFYAARFGENRCLVLPFVNRGLIAARNWIKSHSIDAGYARHWQLDDNIRWIYRRYRTNRIRCDSGVALAVTEDFVDRYENVAIAGLNYEMFAPGTKRFPPFYLNKHVYSCTLVMNSIPYRWRSALNDDTDMCLQVLSGGFCTVAMNIFLTKKCKTMTVKGGNTGIYQEDGRLRMAKSLERLWPGVVETKRRFQRPQHVVKDGWRLFDTPLKLKPEFVGKVWEPNEYGMELTQVAPQIRSQNVRNLLQEWQRG